MPKPVSQSWSLGAIFVSMSAGVGVGDELLYPRAVIGMNVVSEVLGRVPLTRKFISWPCIDSLLKTNFTKSGQSFGGIIGAEEKGT